MLPLHSFYSNSAIALINEAIFQFTSVSACFLKFNLNLRIITLLNIMKSLLTLKTLYTFLERYLLFVVKFPSKIILLSGTSVFISWVILVQNVENLSIFI